ELDTPYPFHAGFDKVAITFLAFMQSVLDLFQIGYIADKTFQRYDPAVFRKDTLALLPDPLLLGIPVIDAVNQLIRLTLRESDLNPVPYIIAIRRMDDVVERNLPAVHQRRRLITRQIPAAFADK